MLLDMGVFGDISDGYKKGLSQAYDQFTAWRKSVGIPSSQKRFKYLLRDGYGFFLNAKGYNARIISEWLMNELGNLVDPAGDEIMAASLDALKLGCNLVRS